MACFAERILIGCFHLNVNAFVTIYFQYLPTFCNAMLVMN